MHTYTHTNSQFETSNANVQSIDGTRLLSDVSIARWKADKGCVNYQKQDSHTLSFYLTGGKSCYRSDSKDTKGAPRTFCLMPQKHDSLWNINDEISFVHLYFSDELLKRYAATTFDIDVRFVEIMDLVYRQDNVLQQLFMTYFSQCELNGFGSPLFAEQAIHKVLHHLLSQYNGFNVKEHNISGGLSPFNRRTIKELIDQNSSDKLTIEMLATSINLSPFHFARMFTLSFGESPASYITRVRIERTKALLTGKAPLADISVQTGFSNQSHMSRNFKTQTGMTPARYRQALLS
jgi:AraC family transcriptional regulator